MSEPPNDANSALDRLYMNKGPYAGLMLDVRTIQYVLDEAREREGLLEEARGALLFCASYLHFDSAHGDDGEFDDCDNTACVTRRALIARLGATDEATDVQTKA